MELPLSQLPGTLWNIRCRVYELDLFSMQALQTRLLCVIIPFLTPKERGHGYCPFQSGNLDPKKAFADENIH